MSEWQDISTAPKDGQFLVTNENWNGDADGYESVELVNGPFLSDGRIVCQNSGNYCKAGTWTHWMPLPKPPVAS